MAHFELITVKDAEKTAWLYQGFNMPKAKQVEHGFVYKATNAVDIRIAKDVLKIFTYDKNTYVAVPKQDHYKLIAKINGEQKNTIKDLQEDTKFVGINQLLRKYSDLRDGKYKLLKDDPERLFAKVKDELYAYFGDIIKYSSFEITDDYERIFVIVDFGTKHIDVKAQEKVKYDTHYEKRSYQITNENFDVYLGKFAFIVQRDRGPTNRYYQTRTQSNGFVIASKKLENQFGLYTSNGIYVEARPNGWNNFMCFAQVDGQVSNACRKKDWFTILYYTIELHRADEDGICHVPYIALHKAQTENLYMCKVCLKFFPPEEVVSDSSDSNDFPRNFRCKEHGYYDINILKGREYLEKVEKDKMSYFENIYQEKVKEAEKNRIH